MKLASYKGTHPGIAGHCAARALPITPPTPATARDGCNLVAKWIFKMEHEMGIETGAGVFLSAKYGLAAKVTTMFAASAAGAAIIAAYHPDTRAQTWWRALGAGVGGVLMGSPACRAASHYVPWMFSGSTVDDLGVIGTVLFIVGALFWGLVGALQGLAKKIQDRAPSAIAAKLSIEDKSEVHP